MPSRPKSRTIDWLLMTLLGGSTGYFLLSYWTEPSRPDWFHYADQGSYLVMAQQLSHFGLTKLAFLFGLGYPVVAVPALWIGLGHDPFMPFNLAAFVFVAYATYTAGSRLVSRAVGAVAAFALIFASPLIAYMILPWNSTVSIVCAAGLLLIASKPNRGWQAAAAAGALLAWAFAARYVDVLWLLPVTLVATYQGSMRASLKNWAVAGAVAFLLALPVLAAHQHFFGSPFKTPYSRPGLTEESLAGGSYSLARIPRASVALFIGSDQAGAPDHHRGLLNFMPWALAAVPGAYLLLRKPGRTRLVFGTIIAVIVIGSLFYLSYRASEPSMFKFGTTHYFKLFWPYLAILSATALVSLFPNSARPSRRK